MHKKIRIISFFIICISVFMILMFGVAHLYYKLEYESEICNIRSRQPINNIEIRIYYSLSLNNITYYGSSAIYNSYTNTTISCYYNKYRSEISLEKNNTSILSVSLLCLTISSYFLFSAIIILIIQILYIKFYISIPASASDISDSLEENIDMLGDDIIIN